MADKEKKQVPLRLSKSLYDELARWAEDDFRSLNGQIEYLLTECVKKRKKNSVRRESEDVPDSFERGSGSDT
ncbi:MAG: PTS ascorbate transporter subunit IIC [Clostridia bacterium]|nr:PTS ascorbate transporter subunit IIC [Clostridia bacterium]